MTSRLRQESEKGISQKWCEERTPLNLLNTSNSCSERFLENIRWRIIAYKMLLTTLSMKACPCLQHKRNVRECQSQERSTHSGAAIISLKCWSQEVMSNLLWETSNPSIKGNFATLPILCDDIMAVPTQNGALSQGGQAHHFVVRDVEGRQRRRGKTLCE